MESLKLFTIKDGKKICNATNEECLMDVNNAELKCDDCPMKPKAISAMLKGEVELSFDNAQEVEPEDSQLTGNESGAWVSDDTSKYDVVSPGPGTFEGFFHINKLDSFDDSIAEEQAKTLYPEDKEKREIFIGGYKYAVKILMG